MSTSSRHHETGCPTPLSPEARAWEIAKLRELGLDDVPWCSEDLCPFCAGRPLSVELKWAKEDGQSQPPAALSAE